MFMEQSLKQAIVNALQELYQIQNTPDDIVLSFTRKEHEGDFTLVVFPYIKVSGKSPQQTAEEIGNEVQKNLPDVVHSFNVVKGFLNFTIRDDIWLQFFKEAID